MENKFQENKVEGRNAVLEAFRSGKTVDKLFVQEHCEDGPVRSILREAKKQDTIVKFVKKERLDQLSETGKHQGVIAVTAAYAYAEIEDILAAAGEKGEPPFLFLLDNIEDPHNLGAIIRTGGGSWCDYSQEQGSGTDGHSSENICWGIELYPCGKSDQYGTNDRGSEKRRNVVCMCGYGRHFHV